MSSSKREMFFRVAVAAFAVAALTLSGSAFADTYAYDALGRLVGVTYVDGSTISYTYDAAGNRTVLTQTSP